MQVCSCLYEMILIKTLSKKCQSKKEDFNLGRDTIIGSHVYRPSRGFCLCKSNEQGYNSR
jgi:hypothetical protein